MFCAASTVLAYGINRAGIDGRWRSIGVILPIVFGCLGLVAWPFHQAVVKHPSLDVRALRHRNPPLAFLVLLLSAFSNSIVFYQLPSYFRGVKLMDAHLVGVAMLAVGLTSTAFCIGIGFWIKRTGAYRGMLLIAWAWMAVSLGLLSLLGRNSPTIAWVGVSIALGLAIGILLDANSVRQGSREVADRPVRSTRVASTSASRVGEGLSVERDPARCRDLDRHRPVGHLVGAARPTRRLEPAAQRPARPYRRFVR